ncbi:hypothetical protein GMA11_06915 [Granulicatella sp. zg-ZJ]|uniref:hypothetical protein n=1 Tax=Granulicatella sp. zg-ZJ TaxID=2678504 RepID=UPI0013D350C3|nr:hypothetical protein [Granulicatella sp. zg-ZJ]NEW63125.1 hypothetical protein [Granulicatella sp. zg-ZJ]
MRKKRYIFVLGVLLGLTSLFVYHHISTVQVPVKHGQKKEKIVSKLEPVAFSFEKALTLDNIQSKEEVDEGDSQRKKLSFQPLKIHEDEDNPSSKIGRNMFKTYYKGKQIAHYSILGDNLYLHKGAGFESDVEKATAENFVQDCLDIIPNQFREHLTDYYVYKKGDALAFVSPPRREQRYSTALSLSSLDLFMNMKHDYADKLYELEMVTFIHEFGHILSFMPNHLNFTVNISKQLSIPESMQEEFHKDSYLRQFFTKYWKNVDEKWIDADETTWQEESKFFRLNRDNFVSVYAAKNIYEDFAESFLHFILTKSSDLDISKPYTQKLLFFYQYPELVSLRTYMLTKMVEHENK